MVRADPTDPKIDDWLLAQEPGNEFALRYSIRGRFHSAELSAAFNARVDELFAILDPDEGELAAILRCARERGEAIDEIGLPKTAGRRR